MEEKQFITILCITFYSIDNVIDIVPVGRTVGVPVGLTVGVPVGVIVGLTVGMADGETESKHDFLKTILHAKYGDSKTTCRSDGEYDRRHTWWTTNIKTQFIKQ